jgi:hypothetical protein
VELDPIVVRRHLARLAEQNVRPQYGVDQHGYQLRPAVGEATLARAERAIGGPLPAAYRHFVTVIGDGGAGPYYGVIPLGEALDRLQERFGTLDPLGRDCPLRTDTYMDYPWVDGRLPIVDYGCGDWLFLVVRGPRRGIVWVDSVAGGTGLYCLEVDFATFTGAGWPPSRLGQKAASRL